VKPLTVVVLGPAPSVQGGVTTVQGMIADGAPSDVQLHHIASHDRATALFKIYVALRALGSLCWMRLSRRRADVFHIHFGVRGSLWRACAFIVLIRALFSKPIVLHAHGPDFQEFFARQSRPARYLVRRIFARCSGLIALSESWQEYYERELELPGERVVVLHNPIRWREVSGGIEGDGEVRMVFLGRLGERKGVPTLLAASARLAGRWSLTLAGDGDVAGTEALARELGVDGCTTIHGWVGPEERDALLRDSDVFVLPSKHEGLPAALLEAMSFGLAVVTTPVGGIPEVVESEVNGLLVAPGDDGALAMALQRLVDDEALRKQLAERGRQSVEHLRIERYWERLRELYMRVQGASAEAHPRRADVATDGRGNFGEAALTPSNEQERR
jgi:glycosyltransferase involved in cell wall biosynthesis